MRPASLASPVSMLMRPTLQVESVDSLALAAGRYRQNGAGVLPVAKDGRLVGVVTDRVLANALGAGVEPTDAVGDWLAESDEIYNYESGAEALRRIGEGGTLVVIDQDRRVLGLLSAVDLWPRRRPQLRPPLVGGMATPFGVYLTTGSVSGGAPMWALFATGAAMSSMMVIATITVNMLDGWLSAHHVPGSVLDTAAPIALLGVFFGLMRLVPLSGIHGAEHQVVHAIEREEDLQPDVIRRMPRVHPRCGTNIATGAILFLGLMEWEWTSSLEIRLVVAALVTVFLWRRLGGLLQQFVTTKRPTDKQLESGIKAGKMLLERYAKAKTAFPSVPQRIWNSGMLQVMSGAFLIVGIVHGLVLLFHLDFGPLVSL